MENTAEQEYIDNLLSQTTILYSKIDNQGFSVQESERVKGNDMEKLSNILFPFSAICCQHVFFVSFDEPKDDDENNHTTLLYCVLKCWEYAIKKRNDYLNRIESANVNVAHLDIKALKDVRKQEFSDKENLVRALIDYMRDRLGLEFWEDYDILLGRKIGQISYGSCNLDDSKSDLAIPFIISNDLFEELKKYYPFWVEASSVTVLKILQSPFKNDIEKIKYNFDKSIMDKELAVKDTRMGDRIQINNSDDICRNSSGEIIKHEHENNENKDYNVIGRGER